MKRPLFLITGPSGSGKSTIASALSNQYDIPLVKSYTTRKPRYPGEDTYHFVDPLLFQKFQDMTNITLYNNNFYGVRLHDLHGPAMYIVDPPGVDYMRNHHSGLFDIKVILITATPEECATRMLTRGDKYNAVQSRIQNDQTLFNRPASDYDIVIYNRNLTDSLIPVWAFMHQVIEQYVLDKRAENETNTRNFNFLNDMFQKHGANRGKISFKDGKFVGYIENDIIFTSNDPNYPIVNQNLLEKYRHSEFIIQPYNANGELVNITIELAGTPDPLFMVDRPPKTNMEGNETHEPV